jgi:hypothetical protein
MVLLAAVGLGVLVVMALAEARNLSRGPRRPGPLIRVLILVVVAMRLATWLFGS